MNVKLLGIVAGFVLLLLIGIPIVLGLTIGRETTRDLIIITWGVLSILAFGLMCMFFLTLATGTNKLIGNVRTVVNDDLRPIIHTGEETVKNVTGTSRFVGDTVVQPIIRLYGIIAGVRRGFSVFTRVSGRGKKKV